MGMMARRLVGVTAAIALATSSFAAVAQQPSKAPDAPAQGSKQAQDEAKLHYDRGIQLYNEGAYELALIEFQRAYQLFPNYKILFNIGQVSAQLGNYAGATQALRKF